MYSVFVLHPKQNCLSNPCKCQHVLVLLQLPDSASPTCESSHGPAVAVVALRVIQSTMGRVQAFEGDCSQPLPHPPFCYSYRFAGIGSSVFPQFGDVVCCCEHSVDLFGLGTMQQKTSRLRLMWLCNFNEADQSAPSAVSKSVKSQ